MRLVETMRGKGVSIDEAGRKRLVDYFLDVYQNEIHAGPASSPVFGLKDIRGRILPVGSFVGLNTLEMSDGRKLQFFYCDAYGSIALSKWIG